jgi:predicted DCC family thiol-disulfide oxidoreductase YuxK
MAKVKKETVQNVILFDGVCNLCNGAVNFIIDHDPKGKFNFAALQSNYGQAELKKLGYKTDEFDSLVLLTKGEVFVKSTAALKIANQLSGIYSILHLFIILPASLRDWVYDIIAKNRYKWFGKRDSCRMPTPELKQRFMGA